MADDIYFGLADGNSDLFSGYPTREQRTEDRIGMQPGVGDHVDIYRGPGRGNADLSCSFRDLAFWVTVQLAPPIDGASSRDC